VAGPNKHLLGEEYVSLLHHSSSSPEATLAEERKKWSIQGKILFSLLALGVVCAGIVMVNNHTYGTNAEIHSRMKPNQLLFEISDSNNVADEQGSSSGGGGGGEEDNNNKKSDDHFPEAVAGESMVENRRQGKSIRNNWMKGLQRGELFYTDSIEGVVRRNKVDEYTHRIFYEEVVRKDIGSPQDMQIDVDGGKIFYSDSSKGQIRKVDFDGQGVCEVVVNGQPDIRLIAPDIQARVMYFTAGAGDEGQGIFSTSMDPEDVRNGGEAELVVGDTEKVGGISVGEHSSGERFLYFTDYTKGTLNRLNVESMSHEVVLESMIKPTDLAFDGKKQRAFVIQNSGSEIAYYDVETGECISVITGLGESAKAVEVDGEGGVIWLDRRGSLFRTDLSVHTDFPLVFEREDEDTFLPVGTDLHRPNGFAIYLWPAASGLSFSALNSYNSLGEFPYAEVDENMPWLLGKIVEPARATTLTVDDPCEGCTYHWELDGDERRSTLRFEGSQVPDIKLYRTGKHKLTLTEYDSSGAQLRQLRSYAEVKYVRREIRTLHEEDREKFLDILETLREVPTRQGKMIYGGFYEDMSWLADNYNTKSSDRLCDHINEGMGFLPNIMAFTLLAEQVMQSIDPSFAMPYWDYTIDSHAVEAEHGGDFESFFSSEIFQPDWFGSADTDYHTITQGRFAWKKIEQDCYTCVHNSYGFMRSPWNNNASPFVTRWRTLAGVNSWDLLGNLPGCSSHHMALSNFNTWEMFAMRIQQVPHQNVHRILGGTFESEEVYENLGKFLEPDDLAMLRTRSGSIPKDLWRHGLMECPEHCHGLHDVMAECRCTCGSDEEVRAKLRDPETFDFHLDVITKGKGLATELSLDQQVEVVATLCQAGTGASDLSSGGAANDPLFWPIHPTLERLYFQRRLRQGFDDMTWPMPDDAYKGVVFRSLNKKCYGHAQRDVMPYFFRMDDYMQTFGMFYTTGQFMQNIDPSSNQYAAPYVYDNYRWDHCAEEGLDFQEF